jgi:DNA-binding XRE family transcriptional regulator
LFTTFRSVEGDRTSQLNVEQGEEQDVMPLALHIRRLRQWYGETGLSQAELAKLAGVSPKSLYAHEHRRALPQVVESLLALALALKVPFDALIDPRIVQHVSSAIEERRRALEERARPSAESHGDEAP